MLIGNLANIVNISYLFRKKGIMNILKFTEQFSDNESCKLHLREQREKEGVVCKKCQCTKHYWLNNKWMWQCSVCNFRTSLRSGTIMESQIYQYVSGI